MTTIEKITRPIIIMIVSLALIFYLATSALSDDLMASAEETSDSTMLWPVEEPYRISDPFGYREFNGIGWHNGLDIPTGGKPNRIFAAESGKVIFAGEMRGYGNVIMIRHCEEIVTLYAHIASSDEVAIDDNVERGDAIGRAGATGDATGVHLHFEVQVNGLPQDPLPYLGRASFRPIHDDFNKRIPFKDFNNVVVVRGTNDCAGKEDGEPNHGDNQGGKSVWWRWNAPHEGLFFFKTTNSKFVATLGVYTGSTLSSLVNKASSNNAGGSPLSLFHAVPETEYQVAVDGFNGASGFFNLSWGEISSGSIKGRVTDKETKAPVENVKITASSLDYKYRVETVTDKNGNYSFSHIPIQFNDITFSHNKYNPDERSGVSVQEGESRVIDIALESYIPGFGNVTGEGGVTVVDAIWILRHLVGLIELTPEQLSRAKVSGQDDLSITDAILILRYIVGLIDKFPVELY